MKECRHYVPVGEFCSACAFENTQASIRPLEGPLNKIATALERLVEIIDECTEDKGDE